MVVKFTASHTVPSQEIFQSRDIARSPLTRGGVCYETLRYILPSLIPLSFAPRRVFSVGSPIHPIVSEGVVAVSARPIILAVYHDYTRKTVRYIAVRTPRYCVSSLMVLCTPLAKRRSIFLAPILLPPGDLGKYTVSYRDMRCTRPTIVISCVISRMFLSRVSHSGKLGRDLWSEISLNKYYCCKNNHLIVFIHIFPVLIRKCNKYNIEAISNFLYLKITNCFLVLKVTILWVMWSDFGFGGLFRQQLENVIQLATYTPQRYSLVRPEGKGRNASGGIYSVPR